MLRISAERLRNLILDVFLGALAVAFVAGAVIVVSALFAVSMAVLAISAAVTIVPDAFW